MPARRCIVIQGAAGRDFHNFNVVYRDDAAAEVVAFTTAQIRGIASRPYPSELVGPLYPDGIHILYVPMNGEATGLTIAPDYNGHAWIMSNFQHPDEGGTLSNYLGADRDEVLAAINSKWDNRRKAAIGYIGTKHGALPAFE